VRTDERITLGHYLTRWLEVIGPSVRPRTLVNYRIDVTRHIIPALGHIRLSALTSDDCQLFLNAKLDSLTPKSVSNLRGTLRAALHHAVDTGALAKNVAAKTKAPS
jgi:hypothetical protein